MLAVTPYPIEMRRVEVHKEENAASDIVWTVSLLNVQYYGVLDVRHTGVGHRAT